MGVLALLVALVVVAAVHAVTGRHPAVVPAPDRPPVHPTTKVAHAAGACPRASHELVRSAPARGRARTVALTFDDGPGPWTPKVLAVLHQQEVHATFFVIGRWAAVNPRLLRSVVSSGNELGNHSWSHHVPRATVGWRTANLTRELHRTDRAVARSTGHRPCFFRPRVASITGRGLRPWPMDCPSPCGRWTPGTGQSNAPAGHDRPPRSADAPALGCGSGIQ